MKELIKNYSSTMLFILIGYFFFSSNNYYKSFYNQDIKFIDYTINSVDVFHIIILLYAIFLIPFYIFEKEKSKARISINFLIKKIKDVKYKINKDEKTSILAWFVKLFFTPMIILWLVNSSGTIVNKFYGIKGEYNFFFDNFLYFFNNYIFLTILTIIIFIDLLMFTFGYLLESKYLGNKIKSVEPTIFGWLVALICYPPFNISLENIFGWYSSNLPNFENIYIHVTLNITLLIFFGIYTRASVALGFKASNLTNRGIISKGPYKYVRHPAYICKNISWLIGAFPIIFLNIMELNFRNLFLIIFSITAWGYIYYLRAITEEKHLEADKDYIKYKNKVKYKFIPKII